MFVVREGSLQRLALLQWWWGERGNSSIAKEAVKKLLRNSHLCIRLKVGYYNWERRILVTGAGVAGLLLLWMSSLITPDRSIIIVNVSWLFKGLCKVGSHETAILHKWSEGGFCSWSDRPPSGRPAATVNEDNSKHIDDLITADGRMIIQRSRDITCNLMQSLGYSKICAKHILKMLMNTMKK